MAKGLALSLGATEEDQRLHRVLAWLGFARRLEVQRATSTALGQLHVHNSILKHLCQQLQPELAGSDALQMVQVSQWADLASLLVQRDDRFFTEKMAKIDERLQANSYLAANRFTLADACIFDVIAVRLDANKELAGSLQPLTNLKRWFAHVQETAHNNAQGAGVALPKHVALPLEHATTVVSKLTFGGKNGGATEQKEAEGKPAKQSKKQKQQAEAQAEGDNKKKKAKQQKDGAAAAPAGEGEQQQQQQGKKKEKKPKKEKKAEQPETKAADDIDVSKLDIRVGHIRRAWEHEDSVNLFCEEIDIGEESPRMIASGLRNFYKLADLQDRKVLVVANLKARNMGGFSSQGMVICASNDDHSQVKFVEVPASAKPGDRVTFDEFPGEPMTASQVQKKKVLEKVLPELVTDSNGVPMYKGSQFKVNGEPCTSPLPNAHVG